MNPGLFYFEFEDVTDEDIEPLIYGFVLTPEGAKKLRDQEMDEFDPWYEETIAEAEEKWGTHDISGDNNPDVDVYAFSSYEIPVENYLKVMDLWRAAFVAVCGKENIGPVISVRRGEKDNDLSIYSLIKNG